MAAVDPPPVNVIRSVWSNNLEDEFSQIRDLIDQYRCISMDTEFPGVIIPLPPPPIRNPTAYYEHLKSNVNALKLIQVGITLVDSSGCRYIWEFNFRDFDMSRDPHAQSSIKLLRDGGMNFDTMHEFGISVSHFAELMMSSGLVCSDYVTYVTFHGGYDFGYLIKALTGRNLPETLPEFVDLLRVFFGNRVYDVKIIIKSFVELHGGLDTVARLLGIERSVGRQHQAGSDSLLTWLVYENIMARYFGNGADEGEMDRFGCVIYGLEN
ncbi:hypothetical protein ACJIZ3_023928 [Penstemon smallii]|uniref:poly(A)-specific ribonuclease n=1 Tax=Penstemon smallii TaxID=265156 RepID=A0ABD3TRD7_9LAMI